MSDDYLKAKAEFEDLLAPSTGIFGDHSGHDKPRVSCTAAGVSIVFSCDACGLPRAFTLEWPEAVCFAYNVEPRMVASGVNHFSQQMQPQARQVLAEFLRGVKMDSVHYMISRGGLWSPILSCAACGADANRTGAPGFPAHEAKRWCEDAKARGFLRGDAEALLGQIANAVRARMKR